MPTTRGPEESDSGHAEDGFAGQDGGHICYLCKLIDFDEVFHGRARTYSDIFRPVSHILTEQNCAFCQLTRQAIPDPKVWETGVEKWIITRGDFSGYLGWDTHDLEGDLRDVLHGFPMCTIGMEILDVPVTPQFWGSTKAPYRVQLLAPEHSRHKGRTRNSTYLRYPRSVGFGPSFRQSDQATLDYLPVDIFCARPIEPLVDTKLLARWLRQCHDLHVETCQPAPISQEARSRFHFRLIDVQQECIVDAPASSVYVCLSYVWGQVKQVKLTKSNKAAICTAGGLSPTSMHLSNTVRDAITLCNRMQLPYLWCDTLCILQDDLNDLKAHIENMDTIFKSAHLTIVAAAESDANAGLPGVQTPRTAKQTTALIKGYELTTCPDLPPFAIEKSTWRRRAWTYQEERLSHRMLGFLPDQAYFWCQNISWDLPVYEATIHDCDAGHAHTPQMVQKPRKHGEKRIGLSYLDDLFAYTDMVEEYTQRNLTFESDMLNAFNGLMACFGGLMDGEPTQWVFGLPIAAFGWCLCWESGIERPARPVDVVWNATPAPTIRRPEFPSWSWAGWKTRVCISGHHSPDAHASYSNTFLMLKEDRPSGIFTSREVDEALFAKHGFRIAPYGFGEGSVDLKDGILTFVTSFAQLRVARVLTEETDSADPNCMRYRISLPENEEVSMGFIALESGWRDQASDFLDFIVIHVVDGQRRNRRDRARGRCKNSEKLSRSTSNASLPENAYETFDTSQLDENGARSGDRLDFAGNSQGIGTPAGDSPNRESIPLLQNKDVGHLDAGRMADDTSANAEVFETGRHHGSNLEEAAQAPLQQTNDDGSSDSSLFALPQISLRQSAPVRRDRSKSDDSSDRPTYVPSWGQVAYASNYADSGEGEDGIPDIQIYLMCIEWQGDIAYRVQMAGGDRSDDDWMKANPVERIIKLG